MSSSSMYLPAGQDWLLERIKAVVPNVRMQGICFGLAHMGMQAILAGDLASFEKRLQLIKTIPARKFEEFIKTNKEQRLFIIKKIKGDIYLQNKDEINKIKEEAAVQDDLKQLEKTLLELIEKNELKAEEQKREYDLRSEEILLYAFLRKNNAFIQQIQQKITEAIEQWPEEAKEVLQIQVFMEGLQLYHVPYLYPQLFEEKSAPKNQGNDLEVVIPLVVSKKLEERGGVVELKEHRFSGVYSKEDLKEYFFSLEAFIKKKDIKEPFVLVVSSSNHRMTVGYDPRKKKKKWIFIDANQLPPRHIDCEKIFDFFSSSIFCSQETPAIFSTTIYCSKNKNEEEKQEGGKIEEMISAWQSTPTWQRLHAMTKEKSMLTDCYSSSWLWIAANKGNLSYVKALLDCGADPNAANNNGVTPLFIAAQEGHLDVVKALLAHEKTDPNAAMNNGATPLFMAAQKGHLEIVKALLEAGAEPDLEFKSTVKDLLKFANNRNVMKEMEEFLKQTLKENGSPSVDSTEVIMRAEDIAFVMGREEIVNILRERQVSDKKSKMIL